MCSCVCVYPVSAGLTLLRMLGLHQLKGPGVIRSEYWGLTSQISKVLPARVLGFFASRSTGGCFSSWSAGVLPARVLGFYQTECWGFTSRSAEVFYQPECWSFTSRSAGIFTSRSSGVLPAGVLGSYQPGCFIQPERWGRYQPECWGFTSHSPGFFYQPEC